MLEVDQRNPPAFFEEGTNSKGHLHKHLEIQYRIHSQWVGATLLGHLPDRAPLKVPFMTVPVSQIEVKVQLVPLSVYVLTDEM